MNKSPFTKLEIKEFRLKEDGENKYLVYKDKKEFIEVTAESASEAVEKSHIDNPYSIIYYNQNQKRYLNQEDIEELAILPENTVENTAEKTSSQPIIKPEKE